MLTHNTDPYPNSGGTLNSIMAAELQQRLDYLIHDLKAYEGFNHRGKGLRNAVKTQLNWWAKTQQDMNTIRVPYLFEDLWKAARARNHQQYIAQATGQDWRQFLVLESGDRHLRIEDKRGHLLAYSQQKYVKEPRLTSDHYRDLPFSQQWLDANQGLFQHLSDVLRLLEPEMFVRYTSIKPFLPEGIQPACGAWYACALNQGMTTDGEAHFDHSDYYCGLNAVTGWGDYTGAKLILWQLGLAIENTPRDAILFLGRILTHNSVDIQGGTRSMVDAFVHQAPLIWKDRQHKELTGYGRKGKSGKARKEGKGKEKAAYDIAVEDAENAESAMDAEDPGTDEELGVMYTLRLGEAEEDSD
ncbi:hypothetical protein FGG08_003937 [Glutinoglossum americanum]|uniref:Uncharacterized protein n=1 Tax=Glutinoglossum americanum TaxID=1670608 RepID=A0A9P8I640_9PEZI|nr:hypothetical protein FGG08_003937 [Glutinoglossum americanum]